METERDETELSQWTFEHRKKRAQTRLSSAAFFLFASIALGCNANGRSANVVKPVSGVQPLFNPITATLAQQKMCDEQAEKKFLKDRYSGFEKKNELPLTSYTSHYDPAVNVCYVRVHSYGGTPLAVSDVVYDAFGGRVYATYIWINSEQKKYWGLSNRVRY